MPVIDAARAPRPDEHDWQRQRGNILADLGFALLDSGDFKDGLDDCEIAIEVQKELVAKDPKGTR